MAKSIIYDHAFNNAENLVKIYLVHSRMLRLQGGPLN